MEGRPWGHSIIGMSKYFMRIMVTKIMFFLTTHIECLSDQYGLHCENQCECLNEGVCHRFYGYCMCPEGTSGDQCETGKTYDYIYLELYT